LVSLCYSIGTIEKLKVSSSSARAESDTAATKGVDFRKGNIFYQVKSNRPSGKPGSKVTLVGKATSFDWHKLVWILYDREYTIKEAWEFTRNKYRELFESEKRISPEDMRKGTKLYK